jgi:hypothetical protein
MLIGLHDAERDTMPGKTYPNYALLKISAWHKAQGDTVEWWDAMNQNYDTVYSSKVFDFTPENPYLPEGTIKGGTGYDIKSKLPPEVDSAYPDYSIYSNCDYSIGYITRGCPNKCRWCVVPEKEGGIVLYRKPRELLRAGKKKLVLMDNNILALPGTVDILTELAETEASVDFNQGMDARLVTPDIANALARLKWTKYIRFSCDSLAQVDAIFRTAELLAERGLKPWRMFIYALVTADISDAAERIALLKQFPGITIYAQAERNERLGICPNAAQLEFAQRYIYGGSYRRETWDEYCTRHIEFEAQNGRL